MGKTSFWCILLALVLLSYDSVLAQELWNIEDRYAFVNNAPIEEKQGQPGAGINIEVGPPWITTGGTTRLVKLFRYNTSRVASTLEIPLDSIFYYLQSDTITLRGDTSTIGFTWSFYGSGLNYILRPDSVLRIEYDICDAHTGAILSTALQAIVDTETFPVYDTASGQYKYLFDAKGIRIFQLPGYNGEQVVTKCRMNSSSLLASIDSADYQFGFVTADYSYPDSLSYFQLSPFFKDTLGQMVTNMVTGVTEPEKTPTEFVLGQNYPNPFNPTTAINYQLPKGTHVTLDVYDVLGREVATLVDGEVPAGYHQTIFNGSRFASGVYFYRLVAGSHVITKKMLMLK